MSISKIANQVCSRPENEFGAGASQQEIEVAEERLGVQLRGDYREFLSRLGWAAIDDQEVLGLGVDVPRHLDLVVNTLSEREEAVPALPHPFIPIMNDGAGNLYCLDYSVSLSSEPPVVLWQHETATQQQPEQVADSFLEWLEERVS